MDTALVLHQTFVPHLSRHLVFCLGCALLWNGRPAGNIANLPKAL